MKNVVYLNRRAAEIENSELCVTVTQEGGHVARILHKSTGINPLWTPAWPSVEPSEFNPELHPEFGNGNEARLVAGLLGHNICLDIFGAPSATEAAAGIPVHGEAPVALYELHGTGTDMHLQTELPLAEMRFSRSIRLAADGVVCFREKVENLAATDRPIGWTQHVTLGAPFLDPGSTQFYITATRSRTIGAEFNNGLGTQRPDEDFAWPTCPMRDGSVEDLRLLTDRPVSGGFTAHLMDAAASCANFVAWSPRLQVLIGYAWHQKDFPWLARWEENHLRTWAPWNQQGFALGLEFGVSPFVEDRQQMVNRGSMFGTPAFQWLGARSSREVEYCAFVRAAEALPIAVDWDGKEHIALRFA